MYSLFLIKIAVVGSIPNKTKYGIEFCNVSKQVEKSVLTFLQYNTFPLKYLNNIYIYFRVSKKNDPTVAQFNKYPDLKHEYRSLKVGDFTWIALHKINKQELVLPYIVERKRMDDLGASIKDGRFHEQKFRLRKCGLKNVIYMVENYGSNKQVGLPVHTLMQALANTRVQDDFKVQVTDSLTHSARFLAMMTLRLTFEYKVNFLTFLLLNISCVNGVWQNSIIHFASPERGN